MAVFILISAIKKNNNKKVSVQVLGAVMIKKCNSFKSKRRRKIFIDMIFLNYYYCF